jgi:hypothetical protein
MCMCHHVKSTYILTLAKLSGLFFEGPEGQYDLALLLNECKAPAQERRGHVSRRKQNGQKNDIPSMRLEFMTLGLLDPRSNQLS